MPERIDDRSDLDRQIADEENAADIRLIDLAERAAKGMQLSPAANREIAQALIGARTMARAMALNLIDAMQKGIADLERKIREMDA